MNMREREKLELQFKGCKRYKDKFYSMKAEGKQNIPICFGNPSQLGLSTPSKLFPREKEMLSILSSSTVQLQTSSQSLAIIVPLVFIFPLRNAPEGDLSKQSGSVTP